MAVCGLRVQKAKDKDQKEHLLDASAWRRHMEHPPVNPLVHVAYDPPKFGVQDQMLRSVLQRLLLNRRRRVCGAGRSGPARRVRGCSRCPAGCQLS